MERRHRESCPGKGEPGGTAGFQRGKVKLSGGVVESLEDDPGTLGRMAAPSRTGPPPPVRMKCPGCLYGVCICACTVCLCIYERPGAAGGCRQQRVPARGRNTVGLRRLCVRLGRGGRDGSQLGGSRDGAPDGSGHRSTAAGGRPGRRLREAAPRRVGPRARVPGSAKAIRRAAPAAQPGLRASRGPRS